MFRRIGFAGLLIPRRSRSSNAVHFPALRDRSCGVR